MIGITMSEEGFNSTFEHETEEENSTLVDAFKTVAVSMVFYQDTVCSQGSGPRWIGELNLNAFVENLPELEKKYPHMYKHLMQSYKEIIDKAEQLIATLKLQDLPLPSVKVEHNNSVYCHEKTIVHSVYIEDKYCDVWDYFYDIDTNSDDETIEVQVNQYLDTVEPVLIGICEAIASISGNQLQDTDSTPSQS